MARHTTKRLPALMTPRVKKPSEVIRLATSILEDPAAASESQVRRLAILVLADANEEKDTTIDDRLDAKAARADHSDFSYPSLGEMSREQRHKLLYGE